MKNLKLWQKIFIAVCGIGFLGSLMLFVPFVQNLILDFGEKFVVQRPLTREVWIERFTEWGLKYCFIFTSLLLAILFYFCRIKIKKNLTLNNKYFKNLFIGIPILYSFLLTLVFLLMCLAYTLPTKIMQHNVERSVPYFKISTEHGYQNPMGGGSVLDDFTDALMLIEAAHKSDKPFPVAAMLNERPTTEGSPYNTLVSVYGDKNTDYSTTSYGRYWHGYEIFLKPLLLFTNYYGIRQIIMFCQIILVTLLIIFLVQKNYKIYIVPFTATWLFFNPISLCMSMQYNSIFILLILELLLIIIFDEKYASSKKLWIYHFFIFGCLTSYFDFLTYPLVTFGIPIAFLLSLDGNEKFKDNFILLVKCGIVWALGYVMMWAGKWAVGSIVTGTNILSNAKNAIVFRASSSTPWKEHITFFDVVLSNIKNGKIVIFMMSMAIFIFAFRIFKKYKIQKKSYILLVISLLPFVWYFVVKNHSHIHSWMTYRILGISIFSLLLFAISMKKQTE